MSEKKKLQTFSKKAFIEAAATKNEAVLLQVVLEDDKTYTRDEAKQLVESWKQKEAK